ncbi:TPA: hypothetical protein JBG56_01340 [Legionella pneumophila]|uniref:hypothetical protein n=1 Tax=Legionella pneumophila TaxID=446 RepID=UPI000D07AF8A|nr:hypothetical protein [Legionella pneumophila]HAT4451865.1 hypothetical protein [Legionella pneumophila]HAT7913749.1 hypothetical protein [Legionella pneumophila]HAT8969493.1 hypothetical protein [Legionella pneumophila subsp. pneumophila]HAT9866668.1 hypothetical protein [Legionella pneumophila subsp. pneumophila]HAU0612318.1 hypothetical protein [Legionella pneumophila]
MSKDEIAKMFATSFKQASNNISAQVFSGSIRFIAIALVILAVMWSVNHMMDAEEKQQHGYLLRLGSRLIRLVIGLMIFILVLFIKETT